MVNVIHLEHVDDVPVIEPNQHNDVPVVPEPVLVDEDEDQEEEEFKEDEEPQEGEEDMEVNIEEDENEPELTYPYEEVDPLNPPPLASELESEDMNKVENTIEHEDETILASVHEVAKDEYYGKLILDLGSEVYSSVEQGMAAMENLVEKLGNVEEKVECKKLKKELEEARFSNTFLRIQNERVERYLYYIGIDLRVTSSVQELIHCFLCDMTESCLKSCHTLTLVLFNRNALRKVSMLCYRAERARMQMLEMKLEDLDRAVELRRWFEKTKSVFWISECAEGKKVKFVAATLQGPDLTWWNAKVATMGLETVNLMPWTEMKLLMTIEFCPIEEVQRMEHELWNLKVKEYNIMAYT
ncbi:hypothetical protein Tco_1524039 [Tanacetum coccineum]